MTSAHDASQGGDAFIELGRTFHELSSQVREADEIELGDAFRIGGSIQWSALLEEFRVVLLSEAGSGKTEELRHIARRLKSENKAAFFLRLENIADDFDLSFEEGTLEEFEAWVAGNDEGWLLLDSIDEARLKSPKDFERAIRRVSQRIQTAKDRVHILITGRTTAWRPKTDREFCQAQLPYTRPKATERTEEVAGEDDWLEAGHTSGATSKTNPATDTSGAVFKIVTLDDLNREQIGLFVAARGILNKAAFLDAIERADAWSFTTRPQDLADLADFWVANGRIGNRVEVLQNSINRRLTERDQDRAEARPLSIDRVRVAVRLLAGAATLTKDPSLRVPDGTENTKGVPVQEVLSDWTEADQTSLLSRPVFDEAIYGTLRFHHRSVREYLAAEWLSHLLSKSSSRRAIEGLFFREQYGLPVITPSLRPILPWLAMMDGSILRRVLSAAPEVLLEGGDPSQLPLEVRRQILHDLGSQIAIGEAGRSFRHIEAVQRFASDDLVPDIRALLKAHSDSDELVAFLYRMVWLGQLRELLPEAMQGAADASSEQYRRMTAIRAVLATGRQTDIASIRSQFTAEAETLNRRLLGELIAGFQISNETLEWLVTSLGKVERRERYSVDQLTDHLITAVDAAELSVLPDLIVQLDQLLNTPPYVEGRYCRVSKRYSWLLLAAAKSVERLIRARSPEAIEPHCLSIIYKLATLRQYNEAGLDGEKTEFSKIIPAWPELNRSVFWYSVNEVRRTEEPHGRRIQEHWQAGVLGNFYVFDQSDYNYALSQIQAQAITDNKLVALGLAFELYRADRTKPRRDALKRATRGNEELETKLSTYLKPPAQPDVQKWKAQERRWKTASAERSASEARNLAEWKAHLASEVGNLKKQAEDTPGVFFRAQSFLYSRLRDRQKSSSRWTEYNWQRLIPEYGDEVARYYRDSAVAFWRNWTPKLRSEGYPANTTPHTVIFGLVGLEIEAHEDLDWVSRLSAEEVVLACKYASFELNGFPTWFPGLFTAHPIIVGDFLLAEIAYELEAATDEAELHYILDDVSWSGQWAWNTLAPTLYRKLLEFEPASRRVLDHLLKILQGSNLPDEALAVLASAKSENAAPSRLGLWLAVLAGVEPTKATEQLQARLDSLEGDEERKAVAIQFLTTLFSDRLDTQAGVRTGFQTAQHLKALYLLVSKYVRLDDDIDRAGGGVYSPEARDNAQEARNRLYDLLLKIPGKESFLALVEIAATMPTRPWFARYPREKAERESDLQAWSPAQVRQFNDRLERTPRNHAELGELAVMRLLDLKDSLEHGDTSDAQILLKPNEEAIRNYIGNALRESAAGRYTIPQEEELADARRPDLRFQGNGFDGPVPVELKIADAGWSGPKLFERMENQLCGDYLRDTRSARGIFVLVYQGKQEKWKLPDGSVGVFADLVKALQDHWTVLSPRFPNIDEIAVIGIDLTIRGRRPLNAAP